MTAEKFYEHCGVVIFLFITSGDHLFYYEFLELSRKDLNKKRHMEYLKVRVRKTKWFNPISFCEKFKYLSKSEILKTKTNCPRMYAENFFFNSKTKCLKFRLIVRQNVSQHQS